MSTSPKKSYIYICETGYTGRIREKLESYGTSTDTIDKKMIELTENVTSVYIKPGTELKILFTYDTLWGKGIDIFSENMHVYANDLQSKYSQYDGIVVLQSNTYYSLTEIYIYLDNLNYCRMCHGLYDVDKIDETPDEKNYVLIFDAESG